MKKLRATDSETIVNREMNYLHDLNHLNVGGEVELW